MTLSERDKRIIWHPFTQEKTASNVIAIKNASGSYIYDENGHAYLDLISSWWVNLHGHCHPEIAKSIYEQALQLEHVIFAGFTHSPAVALCEGLQEILPKQLQRFFFSDNGSTAVEVALKMAYQYWHNHGQTGRSIFLSFDGGYHGDTFGAMSVGFKSGFHDIFSNLLFKVLSIPYPETWDGDEFVCSKEKIALSILDKYLDEHGSNIAAIILEPLVQGASGMRMCRPSFLSDVISRVRAHGILVIFDEIMTGFGRTGTTFALSQVDITPDFLCISKGITGGFLPLALTVVNETIYNAFLSDEWKHAFAHGHSYTANPLACAAALTSLKLLMSRECQDAIAAIHASHKHGLLELQAACSTIGKIRCVGTISAFETRVLDIELKRKFLQAGLLLRPLGKVVYMMPPYSTTATQLEDAYSKICEIIS